MGQYQCYIHVRLLSIVSEKVLFQNNSVSELKE